VEGRSEATRRWSVRASEQESGVELVDAGRPDTQPRRFEAERVEVSPDGRWAATNCDGFSPDGRWLAIDADMLVRMSALMRRGARSGAPSAGAQGCLLWSLESERALPIAVSSDSVLAIPDIGGGSYVVGRMFSPDGRWLLVRFGYNGFADCGYSTEVRFMDLHAADPLLTLVPLSEIGGSRCPGVAFSPDGSWLATDTLLWDLRASPPARQPFVLPGYTHSFDPSGRFLAVRRPAPPTRLEDAPDEPGLWFVPLAPEALIRNACRSAGRNLNREEWREYFPREAYRPICPALPLPPAEADPRFR
jgi:hypothetical protein